MHAILQDPSERNVGCNTNWDDDEERLQPDLFDREMAQIRPSFLLKGEVELLGPSTVIPVHDLSI